MISTKDPIGIIKTYADGFRVYNQYKQTLRDIMNGCFRKRKIIKENVENYFTNMNPRMPQNYLIWFGFMIDGPAGEVKVLQDYYKDIEKLFLL